VISWSDPAIACAPHGWLFRAASYLSVQCDATPAQGPVQAGARPCRGRGLV